MKGLLLAIVLPVLQVHEVPREYVDFVCAVRQLECGAVPAPKLRFDTLPYGARGMFRFADPDTVWLHLGLRDPIYAQAILAHEVSHYVDYRLGRPMDRCTTEAAAFRVYHAWLATHGGLADYARYDWFTTYGCYQ